MKIIKAGIIPEEKEKYMTCYHCKCKFSYVRADVQNDGRNEPYVECPTCKKWLSTFTESNR